MIIEKFYTSAGEIHTLPVNEAEGLIKIGVCSHA